MTDNFEPTFDVSHALEFAKQKQQRGLTEEERTIWTESLKELRDDIPSQLHRQDFSAKTLHKII